MKGLKQFAAILLIIVMLSGVGIGLIFGASGAGQETLEDETTVDETIVDEADDGSLVVPENTDLPEEDLFILNSPKANDKVQSPLSLSGTAKGNMFFEGQFGISIEDSNGKVLGTSFATSTEDWMTENYIPFTANLEFETPTTDTGNLILENDNPSGLEENSKELIIPVNF